MHSGLRTRVAGPGLAVESRQARDTHQEGTVIVIVIWTTSYVTKRIATEMAVPPAVLFVSPAMATLRSAARRQMVIRRWKLAWGARWPSKISRRLATPDRDGTGKE